MELIVALLMIVNGEIKEHRIQIDPETGKHSMSMCLKGKRVAMRSNKNNNVIYQCIKSMAELESNVDGSKSIKKLENLEEALKEENTLGLSKKEVLTLRRAYEKLDKGLGGIRDMKKLPDAIFIVDVNFENGAVAENVTIPIGVQFFWPDASV